MRVHLRVGSRVARRDLPELLARVAAGEVVEIIDGRKRNARPRAFLVATLDNKEN